MKERVRIVGEGIRNAGGASFEHMHVVATIVRKGRSEVVAAEAVGSPCQSGSGGLVHYDELPWGMEGMGEKIDRVIMDAMICRDSVVIVKGAKVVEGEFYTGEELVPQIERELCVHRGEGGDHVVFESTDSSFSNISTMVGRRLKLNSDRDGRRAKIGVEVGGEFVVDSEVGDGMATRGEE